jgi:deoxyribodipyrimidine photo-lyase
MFHTVLLQRCAGRNAFLEELIVRGSLADNFCYYQPHYDSVDAAPQWAQQSLHDLEQRHK